MSLTPRQIHYFEKTSKHEEIKKAISSPREYEFMNYLADIGFRLNIDYIHQFACTQEDVGMVAVADFAFPNEKIVIELDGSSHTDKKQKQLDAKRDKTFIANGYMIFRIETPMTNEDKTFYKYLIKDVYEERHELYQSGKLGKGGRVCKTHRQE